jgi:hypothetical protein
MASKLLDARRGLRGRGSSTPLPLLLTFAAASLLVRRGAGNFRGAERKINFG